nr:MAG TPA: hypothetical protein [Caudoviricetes sp.]
MHFQTQKIDQFAFFAKWSLVHLKHSSLVNFIFLSYNLSTGR